MEKTSKVNFKVEKSLYLIYKKTVEKKGQKLKIISPKLFEEAIKSFIERCKNER